MMVIGKTIKLMDQEFIHMLMEQSMKEIGLKINSMEMEQKYYVAVSKMFSTM